MSIVSALPPEIHQFLALPPPQTVLIRGPPGTGKTTLSLGMLEAFVGHRFLVSSRVTLPQLRQEFPWLPASDGIHLIDAAEPSDTLRDAARRMAHLNDLVEDPEREASLRGLWLPEAVQRTLEREPDHTPTIVAIDSWDALVDRYASAPGSREGTPDRGELERILVDQMSRENLYLVLVLERADLSQLDYLVNGVLETTADGHASRPERWLYLRMLRGTRIDSPAYPFSLEGARFQCIAPLRESLLEPVLPAEPEPEPMEGALWPGSKDFADAFGRLPIGHVSLVERDLSVPIDATFLLVRPIALHVARSGGRVLHILPPNLPAETVLRSYRQFLSADQIAGLVRFQPSGPMGSEERVPPELLLPRPKAGELGSMPRTPEAVRFLREVERPGVPNVSFVWTTALHALAAEEGVDYNPVSLPGMAMYYLSGGPAHVVFIGPDEDPIVRALRSTAVLRILLRATAGRVFVAGQEPPTPNFVLSVGSRETGHPYRLLRVV